MLCRPTAVYGFFSRLNAREEIFGAAKTHHRASFGNTEKSKVLTHSKFSGERQLQCSVRVCMRSHTKWTIKSYKPMSASDLSLLEKKCSQTNGSHPFLEFAEENYRLVINRNNRFGPAIGASHSPVRVIASDTRCAFPPPPPYQSAHTPSRVAHIARRDLRAEVDARRRFPTRYRLSRKVACDFPTSAPPAFAPRAPRAEITRSPSPSNRSR